MKDSSESEKLDADKILSSKRRLEWTAAYHFVNAVRCQGRLTPERKGIIKNVFSCLNLSDERYQGEIRRVINEDEISAIAEFCEGAGTEIEWKKEARYLVPPLMRNNVNDLHLHAANQIANLFTLTHSYSISDNLRAQNYKPDILKEFGVNVFPPAAKDACRTSIVLPDTVDDVKQRLQKENNQRYDRAQSDSDLDSCSIQDSQSSLSESDSTTVSNSMTTKENLERCNTSLKAKNVKPAIIELNSDEDTVSMVSDNNGTEITTKTAAQGAITVRPDLFQNSEKEGAVIVRKRKASTSVEEESGPSKLHIPTTVISKVIAVPSILQRSRNIAVKTAAASINPGTSISIAASCQGGPGSSNATAIKCKTKAVTVPAAKNRNPVVIRSPSIHLKPATSVTPINQDITLKCVQLPTVGVPARIIAPSGLTQRPLAPRPLLPRPPVLVQNLGPVQKLSGAKGQIIVMSTASSTASRNSLTAIGQRLSVPVRAKLNPKRDVASSLQHTKMLQGTSTSNKSPVIVLQKGGSQVNMQRRISFSATATSNTATTTTSTTITTSTATTSITTTATATSIIATANATTTSSKDLVNKVL